MECVELNSLGRYFCDGWRVEVVKFPYEESQPPKNPNPPLRSQEVGVTSRSGKQETLFGKGNSDCCRSVHWDMKKECEKTKMTSETSKKRFKVVVKT